MLRRFAVATCSVGIVASRLDFSLRGPIVERPFHLVYIAEVSGHGVTGGLGIAWHNKPIAAQFANDSMPFLANRHFNLVSGDFDGVSTAPIKLCVHVGHRSALLSDIDHHGLVRLVFIDPVEDRHSWSPVQYLLLLGQISHWHYGPIFRYRIELQ